jgi:hypothetical protein
MWSTPRRRRVQGEGSRFRHCRAREGGAPSTPRPLGSSTTVSGILDRPPSRATTVERAAIARQSGFDFQTAIVIASEAIHLSACGAMDCFVASLLAMTRGHASAVSRLISPELCKNLVPRGSRRAQGMPGARRTRSLGAEKGRRPTSVVTNRFTETSGIPCAMVLRLLRDLPGVPGLLAPVASRNRSACPQRRGDRTTRLDRPLVPHTPCEETSGHRSLSGVRGVHDRPSGWTGWAEICRCFARRPK